MNKLFEKILNESVDKNELLAKLEEIIGPTNEYGCPEGDFFDELGIKSGTNSFDLIKKYARDITDCMDPDGPPGFDWYGDRTAKLYFADGMRVLNRVLQEFGFKAKSVTIHNTKSHRAGMSGQKKWYGGGGSKKIVIKKI